MKLGQSLALLAGATLLFAGCGRDDGPFSLRRAVETKSESVSSGATPLQCGPQTSDDQRRWGCDGKSAPRLEISTTKEATTLFVSAYGPQKMRVAVRSSNVETAKQSGAAGWVDFAVALPRSWRSRKVTLELSGCGSEPCGWGEVATGAKGDKPNVIFIVVDTLRADAVGAYGGPATPSIDAFAKEAVLFERTISQASWTLPSISSMLTGLWPSESPGWSFGAQGIPESATSLPELMTANGYDTGAFIANPLVKESSGYGRGYATYWQAPKESSVFTPAVEVVDRAASWIRSHRGRPFFAYVHILDPHDPYTPPDRRSGAPSTWPGRVSPYFGGKEPLPDEAKVAELRQLYREEVVYTDSQIGRFLDGLPKEVRDSSIIVFTSDHGEEFMEHGFLKHGPAVFNESVHVPLMIAGPGIRKGERIGGLTRLVDIVPTLAELAKLETPRPVARRWRGVSLAASLTEGKAPEPQVAYSESFGFGPLRWSVYDGTTRVIFFNRGHRLPAEFAADEFVSKWITGHLPRESVYRSTAPEPLDVLFEDDSKLRWGRSLMSEYVEGRLGGTWFSFKGNGGGGRLRATVRLANRSKLRPITFFWREGEKVTVQGELLSIDVEDDGIARYLTLVESDPSFVQNAQLVEPAGIALRRSRPDGTLGVHCWFERDQSVMPTGKEKSELFFGLRALGYIN